MALCSITIFNPPKINYTRQVEEIMKIELWAKVNHLHWGHGKKIYMLLKV
jgi:hypothetical protein